MEPSNDPRFYHYSSEHLRDEHLVDLAALADQCIALGESLERARNGSAAVEEVVNDYGHVANLCAAVDDNDRPLLLGTPAEASLVAALVRSAPFLVPLKADEREFLRRGYRRNTHVAEQLGTAQAGRQDDGLELDESGAAILRRWERWMRGEPVNHAAPPEHLISAVKLLASLISHNVTFQ